MKINGYLDKAIARVKNGEEISAVVLSYPEKFRAELAASLQVAAMAYSLATQVRKAPQPVRRKLFLQAKQQNVFFAFFESYKMYASSVAVVAILITSTIFAAASSLPGDKLFVLKKAYETAQLRLTTDPASKANLALNFANARLHDVQQTLTDPSESSNQQQALEEANTQTQVAINSIQQNSGSAVLKDPAVIDSLKNLARTQTNLVAQLPSDQASSPAAQTAKQSAGVLQDLIAAASGSQKSTLPVNPTIDIAGTVTALTSNTITVDKNVYNFEPEGLTVLDKTGSKISSAALQAGESVRIQGIIQNNQNIAQTITISAIPQTAPASGSSSPAAGSAVPNTVSEPALPNDVIGTFIPEPANLP